jgi:hypothetical protein
MIHFIEPAPDPRSLERLKRRSSQAFKPARRRPLSAEFIMRKNLSILGLALLLVASSFLAGCAATSQPSSLTGRPVTNDKGVVIGYQAR